MAGRTGRPGAGHLCWPACRGMPCSLARRAWLAAVCCVRASPAVPPCLPPTCIRSCALPLPPLVVAAGSGPFQILVVMALLVRVIHWAPALAGLGVTVALIPLSTLVREPCWAGGCGGVVSSAPGAQHSRCRRLG